MRLYGRILLYKNCKRKENEKIVVLTGAGIKAESGIKTFRDADGLWEGHDILSRFSFGLEKNPELVLDFL